MGNGTILSNFIIKSVKLYPAKHYALIIADHGYGFVGVSFDDTDHDELSLTELKKSLSKSGMKIDLLIFDACLMSMIEVAYQLREYVNVMVASEGNRIWFNAPEWWGWNTHPYPSVLTKLIENPSMNATELAKIFVEETEKMYSSAIEPVTVSAIDLSHVEELAQSIDSLVSSLRNNMDVYRSKIKDVRDWTFEFITWEMRFEWPPYKKVETGFIDLGDFLDGLKHKIDDENLRNKIDDVKKKMEYVIFAKWNKFAYPLSGLSIYFPSATSLPDPDTFAGRWWIYSSVMGSPALDFSNFHEWDDFLKE
jgi:hypothetical protein